YFFFKAEDGIRDDLVTGVQTCALPIFQQNDDRATQMPQQLTQEHTNFLLADVLKKQEIVEAQAAPLGTDRNSRDDREFVPPSLPMPMDGGFPLRTPGPNHRGD